MCKKNDYGRRAITALLAVLTALFALALMSGGADASPTKEDSAVTNRVAGKMKRSASISKARFKFL